ncbi:MAG: hypothetical protein JW784_03205 [Candidatus Cloacimonetes bacterium]|nr:hypothetical protein [Candidatus Cloacimonadota bacterium]
MGTIRPFILSIILMLGCRNIAGDVQLLKQQALEYFRLEQYGEAIDLLEAARQEDDQDAEIYYYLGFFNHYKAYDSRPLSSYDENYSRQVFAYLDKALELDPDYGDAKYFYGAECSANGLQAMQNRDLEKLKYFYQLAREKGAFPDWLVEFGLNLLNSCQENAILFTGGNADFDVCLYLQLQQKIRPDITLIPIGNIDRPWYVKFLKTGLENGIRPISLKLTDNQIEDLHPFKWKTAEIDIPLSDQIKTCHELSPDYRMTINLEPDLLSSREHAKTQEEIPSLRTYLSPQKAMLVQIIEDNFAERPVYISGLADPFFYEGLNDYLQFCGLVHRLLPTRLTETGRDIDPASLEKLFRAGNFSQLADLRKNNIPRINSLIYHYHRSLLILAGYYYEKRQSDKIEELAEFYREYLAIGFDPEYEADCLRYLERLDQVVKEGTSE